MKAEKIRRMVMAGLILGCVGQAACTGKKADESCPWSVRMAESEMARNPESWQVDFSEQPKWSYCMGLELGAIWKVYERYGDVRFRDYVLDYADTIVSEEGTIHTYNLSDYNLDHISSGRMLFQVWQYDKKPKYEKAVRMLRSQLDSQPRTEEGGFWHKQVYPHQMWLDGIYMAEPFYAEYAARYGQESDRKDIVRQFEVVRSHTYDSVSGLMRHAWDESRTQKWADPVTGQSAHCWGRAYGWYAMALVDVLDYMPTGTQERDALSAILNQVAAQIKKYQDEKTGLWYQVMDRSGDEGNYLEASASSMFVYTLLKGVREGYLPPSFVETGRKGYEGLLKHLVRVDGEGLVTLTQICEVAGLGGSKNYRMGDYDYYINEKKKDNDAKGVGPFILASLEYERLSEVN